MLLKHLLLFVILKILSILSVVLLFLDDKIILILLFNFQKQPSIDVLRKRCSENMQQISEHLCRAASDFFRAFSFWNYNFITHLLYDSFSKKMQMSHMDLKIIWR